jgi:tetratricopeptide (TPR) repeat protein
MNARLCFAVLLGAVCLSTASATAQAPTGAPVASPSVDLGVVNAYNFLERPWFVAGKVTTLQGDPVAGARVEVMPVSASGEFRTLMTNFQGEFETEYYLNGELVKELTVQVRVTKKGFPRAQALIEYASSDKPSVLPFTLRDAEEDPELLPQADLIAGLGARLSKLGASDGLTPPAEKDYGRGVVEFLDRGRADRALPYFSKVTRHDASCLLCRTMLALAELDSGDWDGAHRNLAEVFNNIAGGGKPGRPEPLVALGVMASWKHQPKDASGYFMEALKYAPQDPLALQELGRAQMLIQNYRGADEWLAKAIAAGAKPEARLLHARVLLEGDLFEEASKEMTLYLNGRDVKKMPIPVRQLWAQIENRKKVEAAYLNPKRKGEHVIDYLHDPPVDLEGLEPAADQGQLDSILSAVGKTVADFFANFPNTSSVEEIHQEKVRRNEKATGSLDQKFRYLCFTPAQAWGPGFSEYRADSKGDRAWPEGLRDGFMLTSGFASASLVFHPMYQPQAVFRYLGRQKVGGRDTHLVAFAQQPAKARVNGAFKSGETSMATFSQGLAWIDSQSYQITRLRTDLLKPLREINLEKETTEIAYGEVHFKGSGAIFWVPQRVNVAVDWNGRHFRNEHRYSEYKVFNVEATQKTRKPKELEQASKPTPVSQ